MLWYILVFQLHNGEKKMKEMVLAVLIAYVGLGITPTTLAHEIPPKILPFDITERDQERDNFRAMRKHEIEKRTRNAAYARALAARKACKQKPEACRTPPKNR